MPPESSVRILLETNFLFKHPFDDPQFQRLLALSREEKVHVYVPHIVWEERRTQIVEHILKSLNQAQTAIAKAESSNWSFMTSGLPSQLPRVWDSSDLERRSADGMRRIAADNKIEIINLRDDHSGRVWHRYFAGSAPFRKPKSREDIPDAWILEAAIDLAGEGGQLVALCGEMKDRLLGTALERAGYSVLESLEELFSRIPAEEIPEATLPVAPALAAGFKDLDEQVLGFVAFFRGPSKERLFELLARVGIARTEAETVALRLAQSGKVQDTGSHLLPMPSAESDAAAKKVEPLVISLLSGNGP